MAEPFYKRVLLKLSGEALAGDQGYGIDPTIITTIAQEIKEVVACGVQLSLVIGGGNIFRGLAASSKGMDRASADYMGMLATMINALAMQDALEKVDVIPGSSRPLPCRKLPNPIFVAVPFVTWKKGRVVIFGAGTGNPYFTTDTAASLRAMEVGPKSSLREPRWMVSTPRIPKRI